MAGRPTPELQHRRPLCGRRRWGASHLKLIVGLLALWLAFPAHAQIFSDSEARKAILELRAKLAELQQKDSDLSARIDRLKRRNAISSSLRIRPKPATGDRTAARASRGIDQRSRDSAEAQQGFVRRSRCTAEEDGAVHRYRRWSAGCRRSQRTDCVRSQRWRSFAHPISKGRWRAFSNSSRAIRSRRTCRWRITGSAARITR